MDFSLTTVFVVPVGQTTPSSGATQDLAPGVVGIFSNTYAALTAGTIAAAPYFYVAQGRSNTYLLASKKSDKIKGCPSGSGCNSNVTEWYKVTGCDTPAVQITEISSFNVKCGEDVSLTLRAHSSYIETLYHNGFTRSVTVKTPCCECGADPCDTADVSALIDSLIVKLNQKAPGTNSENISLSTYFIFENIGGTVLRITAKPLTAYGVPCDVSAFPYEYDRLWFRAWVYAGPATSVDFIVADSCEIVGVPTVVQRSSYATGTAAEIKQLEKNYYSYQAIHKHLFTQMGYNQSFESWVTDGEIYTTFYIKFNNLSKSSDTWGDYIKVDSMVIIAVKTGSAEQTALEAILEAGLGAATDDNTCITTTTSTSHSTTTTTSTAAPLNP